jgi:hypothetical protein
MTSRRSFFGALFGGFVAAFGMDRLRIVWPWRRNTLITPEWVTREVGASFAKNLRYAELQQYVFTVDDRIGDVPFVSRWPSGATTLRGRAWVPAQTRGPRS